MAGENGAGSGTELLLASNNSHKHDEFARLLPGFKVLLPKNLGLRFDFEENGTTFLDNALGKALDLYRAAVRPVIADDSGLCVPALGGEPGVYSARYGSQPGGPVLDAPARNQYLLSRMRGLADRRAHFVCCLALVLDESRFLVVQETVHGLVADAPRGTHGFGYDPLFLIPERGLTIAELPDDEKDDVSHRGRAARRLLAVLHNFAGDSIQ